MDGTKIEQEIIPELNGVDSSTSDHQLWVNLSSTLGEGSNIFADIWRTVLKHYFPDEDDDMDGESFELTLPSDNAWQAKIYYKLVEKQRLLERGVPDGMIIDEESKDVKLPGWNILPKNEVCSPEPQPLGIPKLKNLVSTITWTVGDISKAGCLLSIPPQSVNFEDEQEMRRVYSLIYDVFRYKNILTQALNDVAFFQIFSKLEDSIHHVWLLFYDLYHRGFKKRETKVATLASKLFESVGLSSTENALWTQRVRLAAAVSRLRIKHNALSLDELLPSHLKDERVIEQAKNNPVSCWVNCSKVDNMKELTNEIAKVLQLSISNDNDSLKKTTFKWDKHCPYIMAFHSSMRSALSKSHFIKNHLLVVQDKSFCRGAATFGKILIDLGLSGSVIQTHINSPRTTAYLAMLLVKNEKIKKLMAFSAGKRKLEYETYFTELGATNIKIFSDRLIETPADASYMEEVVAIFATPPNSYSAVTDPIDLVCSRGGDLSMLEILTESGETMAARERVMNILDEQKKTLRFAMSRPQIQFVLYETHSDLDAENDGMVNKTLNDINRMAKLQHAALLGKTTVSELQIDEEMFDSKIDENMQVTEAGEDITNAEAMDLAQKKFMLESREMLLESIEEVIRLDDKYMIQMAENRGLFGSTTNQNITKSKSKTLRKRQDQSDRKSKSKKKLKETEIDRIAAPTHTFLSHITHDIQLCRRCQLEQDNMRVPTSQYKRWWWESAKHIMELKKYMIKHKILASQRITQVTEKQIVNSFMASWQMSRLDEIAAKNNENAKFPIFPKLRLSRDNKFVKMQVPVAITTVEFPDSCVFCNK